MVEKQKPAEGAMTDWEWGFLQWALEVGAILREIAETARAEQTETRKTGAEMRAEIKRQLHDLSLEQLLSVARLVGVTEEEIAEDLAQATAVPV